MSNYGDYYVAGIPFNGENALRHFGILGMKWGVRRYQNRDGTLTAEGRARYGSKGEQKKLADKLTTGSAASSNERVRRANRDAVSKLPQVKSAVKQIGYFSKQHAQAEDEYYDAIQRDFYDNSDVYEEYLNKAVDKFMEKYGDTIQLPETAIGKVTPREYVMLEFKNDDWDQGDLGSLEMFMRSNDPRNRVIKETERKLMSIMEQEREATKQLVNEYLGEYADQKGAYSKFIVNGERQYATAAERLRNIIQSEVYNQYLRPRKP